MKIERQDQQAPDRFKRRVIDHQYWIESISYIIVRNWTNLDRHLNQILGVIESMALVRQTLAGNNVAGMLSGEGKVTLVCNNPAAISWETWRGPQTAWIKMLMDPYPKN